MATKNKLLKLLMTVTIPAYDFAVNIVWFSLLYKLMLSPIHTADADATQLGSRRCVLGITLPTYKEVSRTDRHRGMGTQ